MSRTKNLRRRSRRSWVELTSGRFAASVDPDLSQAHFVLARALTMLGQPQDAARECEICREILAREHARTATRALTKMQK